MTPKHLSSVLREFTLPQEIIDQLDKYYVLHWEVDYFLKQATSNQWVITRGDCQFIVLMEFGDTFQNIFSKSQNPVQQVRLSFRKPYPNSLHGYVIVKALNRYDHNIQNTAS